MSVAGWRAQWRPLLGLGLGADAGALCFCLCGALGVAIAERLVDLAGDPEAVHEDSELAGDGDVGALLGILAASLGELEPPALEVAVGTEGTEDAVGAVDQEATDE